MMKNSPPPYPRREGHNPPGQNKSSQAPEPGAAPGPESHASVAGAPQTGAREPAARAAEGATEDAHDLTARLQAENADLKDRLLRALADAENVRRRSERDLNDMRQYAVTKFAGDMAHVADNLERALSSLPSELRESQGVLKTFVDGVELTRKELIRSLEAHGVKKIDPKGERFDPNLHEAMFTVQDPAVPRGTVTTVVQPGYTIGSRPLRPAKVGVAS